MAVKNICVAGHANSGKTSLCEAILYKMGITNRLGSTENGTSILNYMNYEREKKLSVNLSVASISFEGQPIDLIDTPGYLDFQGDMISGLTVADSALVLVDGTSGLEFTTEKVLDISEERNIPRMFFVNKLSKEEANFFDIYDEIREDVGDGVVPLIVPIEEDGNLVGIVDLFLKKAFSEEGEIEIPDSASEIVEKYRNIMIESLAEVDVNLMEKFIEDRKITPEDIAQALKNGFVKGEVFPVIGGDAISLIGINNLLSHIKEVFPLPEESPLPDEIEDVENSTVAYVFKTKYEPHVGELNFIRLWTGNIESGDSLLNNTSGNEEKINQIYRVVGNKREQVDSLNQGEIGVLVKLKETSVSDTLTDADNPVNIAPIDFPSPVMKVAIVPQKEGDEDKIGKGLSKLQKGDPTLQYEFDAESKQLIVKTMGEQHLSYMKQMLEDEYGVSVLEEKPKIHYRETVAKKAEGWAKFKKQTGGRGQYGEVYLRIEPLERGEGVEFVDEIKGGRIPSKFIPSVETGVKDAASKGYLAGYPVVDLKIIVHDGSHHPVDSSDNAFQRAGSLALQDAFNKTSLYLLEPILKVKVIITDEYTGDVMGDLNSRGGRILGIDAEGKFQVINAYIPEREMFKYSNQLRSLTQGTGTYTTEFAFYERVPEDVAERIIEENKKE